MELEANEEAKPQFIIWVVDKVGRGIGYRREIGGAGISGDCFGKIPTCTVADGR